MSVAKPGEVHDSKGYPIYPGDLLRSLHFTGARRKRYWLYHVAVEVDGHLELVPTSHLEGRFARTSGGRCWLTHDMAGDVQILSGSGPGDLCDFEDRPRKREAARGR